MTTCTYPEIELDVHFNLIIYMTTCIMYVHPGLYRIDKLNTNKMNVAYNVECSDIR